MKITVALPSGGVSSGVQARQLRKRSMLTQEELAELAGVPTEHVDFFERQLPVPLDSRRRILRVLWAAKARK